MILSANKASSGTDIASWTFYFVIVKFRTKKIVVSLSLPDDVTLVTALVNSLRINKRQLVRKQGSFKRSLLVDTLY